MENLITKHGLNAEQVLVALTNACQLVAPMSQVTGEAHMEISEETASERLKIDPYVDYWRGRCIKVDFSKFPKLDLGLYMRDTHVDIDRVFELYAEEFILR